MKIRDNTTFKTLLQKNFDFIRDTDILLEVDFPILFSFDADNKSYLAYVTDFKRRKKFLEILFVETNNHTLLELVSEEISLRNALTKFNNKLVSSATCTDVSMNDILSKLPEDDFYLTELLPNRVDIVDKRRIFKQKIQFENQFLSKSMDEIYKNLWEQPNTKRRLVEKMPELERVEIKHSNWEGSSSNRAEVEFVKRSKFAKNSWTEIRSDVLDTCEENENGSKI